MKDLSDNLIPVQTFKFTTKDKYHPAIFDIQLTQDMDVQTLIDDLSMLSLQPKDRLVLISAPKKFNIANVTDANVLSILNTGTTTYKFMLLHNKTSASPKPLDIINFMEETKWLITNT